jgi:hypothetical protein
MSKRFGILSENNETQKQKKKDNNQNLNKDNIFKSTNNNRFSSLNDEPTIINNNNNNTNNNNTNNNNTNNKLKDNKVKEKKQDNRFQILMETNEADEVKVTSFSSEKKKYADSYIDNRVNSHIEFVKEEKQEQVIIVNETLFPTLGLANNNISKQSAVDFKTKLLSNEAPIIEKKVEVKVVTLSEEKEKELANKRLLKQVNKAMSEIVSKMVANGERQRRFYDSIYGNGAYDWEYEKVVDKYEVLYGKDTWTDYYDGEFIYEYSSDSDYENKYEYDNENKYKYDIDVDYNKKCSNWL